MNAIRIVRWVGSPGLTEADKRALQVKAATGKTTSGGSTAVEILQAAQQGYLYPGDVLQLDGFRQPERSTCSYVLHPRPSSLVALASANSSGAAAASVATAASTATPTPAAKPAGDENAGAGEASRPFIARRRVVSPGVSRRPSTPQGRKSSPLVTVGGRASPTPGAGGSRGAAVVSARPPLMTARTASSGKSLTPVPPYKAGGASGPFAGATADAGIVCSGVNKGKRSLAVGGEAGADRTSPLAGAALGGGEWRVCSPVDGATVKKKLRMSSIDGGGGSSVILSSEGSSATATPLSATAKMGSKSGPSSGAPGGGGDCLEKPPKRARTEAEEAATGSLTPTSPTSSRLASLRTPGGGVLVPGAAGLPTKAGAEGAVEVAAEGSVGGGGAEVAQRADPAPRAVVATPAADVDTGVASTFPAAATARKAVASTVAEQIPTAAPAASCPSSAPKASAPPSPPEEERVIVDDDVVDVGDGDESRQVAPSVSATPRERAAKFSAGDGVDGTPVKGREGAGSGTATGALWSVGDLVVLEARLGKGMNKLGGVARVVSVFEDGTYLVKLSMGESPYFVLPLCVASVVHGFSAAECCLCVLL